MKVLFKHELKNLFWERIILCIVNVVVWALLGIFVNIFGDTKGIVTILITISFLMTLLALFVAMDVILIISVIKSFNNRLFTSEGYLTFALPVSLDKMMITKYLVNLFWVMMIGVSYIIGITILSLIVSVGDIQNSFEFIAELCKWIIENPIVVLLYAIRIIASLILTFSALFFVLAVLNCGKIRKAKFIIGVGIFVGITRVIGTISMILSYFSYALVLDENQKLSFVFINIFKESINMFGADSAILNINEFAITVAAGAVLYILARNILNRRLELE